ncbi:MAG: cytochrome c [Ignavibacteria bacterium]|nr:cytochrome c [Ignavibacteria bacterium]
MNRGIAILLGVSLFGCTDMYDGQKIKPMEESRFFADRLSSRPLVEGTIPRGGLRHDPHLYTGKVDGKLVESFPFEITEQVMKRGEERYNTFCSPCHGRTGDGTGMIVQRGFPKPNSFHSDTLRAKPVGHFYDVILNGYGRMYSYAPSIRVDDRWAIAAYIRALQYSRHASAADLTSSERSSLR